ncbi:hypothetical protein [Pseudarthrobacter sulfonivorans]|uniref:hypothetical protein n=1 Tax=Pseudarthrobacter sulfonivorans TaxID=121292 RepID=UPI00286778EA|nr:hypothetical protein [Pseudarthrobacter sulfonivorans]MDR6413483.1 hypothetical protein [Pseudarthrobacter sulfonivorans]
MQNSDQHRTKTPRQLWVAIGISLILASALIYFGFLALPSLAPEHQAFWSGLIGSFVGSAVAFGGAAWLWRMERHILVDERTADRAHVRVHEQKHQDSRSLRDCLAIIGHLKALNFNMHNEAAFATARDKYLMGIRFDEAVSLINDEALRGELAFMQRLVDDDQVLDHFIRPEWVRLDIVHDWLLGLISLGEDQEPASARPQNYDKLSDDLESYEEYRNEQMELIAEYEDQKRAVSNPDAASES